jgi:hypothetical protein
MVRLWCTVLPGLTFNPAARSHELPITGEHLLGPGRPITWLI